MRGLMFCSYGLLLSKGSAFHSTSAVSRQPQSRDSTCSLDSQVKETDTPALLAAKLDVLQGVAKDLRMRERLHLENAAMIDKQHADEMSNQEKRHQMAERRSTERVDQLEAENRHLKQQQEFDEERIIQLTREMLTVSGKIEVLNAQLKRMNTEIEEANQVVAVERKSRNENDETYENRIMNLRTEYEGKCARLTSELEMERENSAIYHADALKFVQQAKNEALKRKEREEIATAAVEASEKRATLLEEKLISSEKKRSRLQAQIKLQRLLISGFLEEGR
jgi:chromosome segregation ATPase